MMTLFESITFSPKKKIIFLILIIFLMGLMMITPLLTYLEDPDIFETVIMADQKMISHLLSIIIVFLSIWIIIDLEHPICASLQAYHGWMNLYLLKLLLIIQWVILLYTPLILIQHGVMIILTQHLPSISILEEIFHRLMDIILMCILSIPLSKTKHPHLAFFIPILFIIHQTLTNDHFSFVIYALCPLFQHAILDYHLAIIYKLCYSGLGLLLISVRLSRKPPF